MNVCSYVSIITSDGVVNIFPEKTAIRTEVFFASRICVTINRETARERMRKYVAASGDF
jgi:hypothetical protein